MTDPDKDMTPEHETEVSTSQLDLFPQRLPGGVQRHASRAAFKMRQDTFGRAGRPITSLGRIDFDGSERIPNTARFDILRDAIRISDRKNSIQVYSYAPIHLLRSPGDDPEARVFNFPLSQLRGLSHPKLGGTMEWKFNLAEARSKILLEGAELNLSTFPPTPGLTQGELLDWQDLGEFSPFALMHGLQLTGLVSRKDRDRPDLETIEIADWRLRGARPAGIIFTEDPGLAGIRLELNVAVAKALRSVLRCLTAHEAHFAEADGHYRISGHSAVGPVICIIDKPEHSLPAFDPLIERPLTYRAQIPTVHLLDRLNWVHSAIEDKDEVVQIKYESPQLKFRADNRIGPSEKSLDVSTTDPAAVSSPSWSLNVQLGLLLNIVKGISSSQFVEVGVLEEQRMLRLHWEDDPVRGWAFLASEAESEN